MKRRGFLGLLGMLLAAWVSLAALWKRAELRRVVAGLVKPQLDADSARGTLSEREVETVVALGETLVAEGQFSPVERAYLVDHVQDRTRTTPGYLKLYRTTAGVLDRLAGAPFAALDRERRVEIMLRHRLASFTTASYFVPFRREELAVRVLAVPDLIAGYYLSPAGWALVGYTTFPGRCGDLGRYTSPEP